MSPLHRHPRQDLHDAPPVLAWIVRIGFTLFAAVFLVIGLTIIFGGGFLGARVSSFGWLGSLFGLPFVIVPIIMIAAVWLSPRRRNDTAAASPSAPSSRPQTMVACAYCGRPRPSPATACESCGAH